MKKITHPIYQDYPHQPYISPERDVEAWAAAPEDFHYGIVAKSQMEKVAEGIFPGDVIMLWRVHFNTFTNESVIPAYVEYRYGVNAEESLQTLLELQYIDLGSALDSLDLLSAPKLKKILEANNLPTSGKKADLLQRIVEHIAEKDLEKYFSVRRYLITPLGDKVLQNNAAIIKKHGTKK